MTKPTKWVCAQRRLRSAGHQPSLIRVFAVRSMGSLGPKCAAKTSRLGGCPGCSESSLGAHSFCLFCHVAAHPTLSWKTTTVICIWKFYSNCLALILVKIISRVDMSKGIKHDFLSINICCAPSVPADVAPRGPADVNASEKPVWALLLHNNGLKLEYFWRIRFEKVYVFLYL